MNTYITSRFFVILTIVVVTPLIRLADANLSPEQLVLLMQASSQRYSSFDAMIKSTYYQYDPNNRTERIPAMTEEVVSRWTWRAPQKLCQFELEGIR